MKIWLQVLLLLGASQVMSCSAVREGTNSAPASNASDLPSAVTLNDRAGRMQLSLSNVKSSEPGEWTSILKLSVDGEELLGGPQDKALSGLWVDGEAVSLSGVDAFRIIDRQSSNDWTYVSVDLTPAKKSKMANFTRRLLHVEPDLVVVCDEFSCAKAAAVEVGWWFPDAVTWEPTREEWQVQLQRAGLTARILGSPRSSERSWLAAASPGWKCVRAGTTNQMLVFRQITALVPHEKQARRSLAFKLLESDSAIGLRVHRDGLPTLIAFRKDTAGEANLTGLKFAGPVAVDVFRPKR